MYTNHWVGNEEEKLQPPNIYYELVPLCALDAVEKLFFPIVHSATDKNTSTMHYPAHVTTVSTVEMRGRNKSVMLPQTWEGTDYTSCFSVVPLIFVKGNLLFCQQQTNQQHQSVQDKSYTNKS